MKDIFMIVKDHNPAERYGLGQYIGEALHMIGDERIALELFHQEKQITKEGTVSLLKYRCSEIDMHDTNGDDMILTITLLYPRTVTKRIWDKIQPVIVAS